MISKYLKYITTATKPCTLSSTCSTPAVWLHCLSEGCGLQRAESANLDQTHSERAKSTRQRSGQTIWATNVQRLILFLWFVLGVLVSVRSQRLFCTDCHPLGAHWLSVVRSREVSASQRFQMYYFYRKSNWGYGFCSLYRGCPPFGESVIRGFTVVYIPLATTINSFFSD